MIEDQPIGTDTIAKMKRGISFGQQIDQFTIVSCRKHHVGIWPTSIGYQFQKDCLSRGDALHSVRAAKQFVQQKQVRRCASARLHQCEKGLYFVPSIVRRIQSG